MLKDNRVQQSSSMSKKQAPVAEIQLSTESVTDIEKIVNRYYNVRTLITDGKLCRRPFALDHKNS